MRDCLNGNLFSEGGSADYIVTGTWSSKAANEVNRTIYWITQQQQTNNVLLKLGDIVVK